MSGTEPFELTKALILLRADRDTERRLLEADLEAAGTTREQTEPWLTALDDFYQAAAITLFRIDNDAPPKLH